MTSHFHYGHAVTGHSPDAEFRQTCLTLRCLADCIRMELGGIVDMLADEAYAHECDARDTLARRDEHAEKYGTAGALEISLEEALAALDCHAMISDIETLDANLSPQRERAPLYVGQPDLWEAELRRIISESDNFPLYINSAKSRQFQVWECSEPWCDWTHADYPHEAGRLHDCLACQARCYCDSEPDAEDCVHCALVDSGESTCDETNGCEAHS